LENLGNMFPPTEEEKKNKSGKKARITASDLTTASTRIVAVERHTYGLLFGQPLWVGGHLQKNEDGHITISINDADPPYLSTRPFHEVQEDMIDRAPSWYTWHCATAVPGVLALLGDLTWAMYCLGCNPP